MALSPEEQAALEEARRRLVNDRARRRALRGSPAARAALEARWAPLSDFLRERRRG